MEIEVPFLNRNLPAFTPVRRRESTINTRLLYGNQEKEWTAARCHRLLRALTSRVTILKKDLSRFQSTGKDNFGEGRVVTNSGSRAVDADWTKTKKRIRQTYSGRGGRNGSDAQKRDARAAAAKKGRRSLVPGEVTIPTPILARARGENPAPPPCPLPTFDDLSVEIFRGTKRSRARCMANEGEGQFQASETLREIRQKTTAARYTTYEGIYNGLEALLRATTKNGSEEKTKRKGPRSLLSMALNAVPCYIAQQEGLLEAHIEETGSKSALDKRDISTEIYDELESFGSSGHGWKRLKDIVRSHGVQVISDAIHLGLLDDAFSGILIVLCINTFAIEEAQLLLSALLSSKQYSGPKTLYDAPSRSLSLLWKYTEFTDRTSFQFRELSNILSSGLLPIEWLATKEFGSIWTSAIQLLSTSSINTDAFIFLDSALSLLSTVGERPSATSNKAIAEAVQNTFSSLLTTLTSIVILSKESNKTSSIEESEQGSRGYDDIMNLLKGSLARYSMSSPPDGQVLLLLSNVIAEYDASFAETDNALVDMLLARLQQKSVKSGNSAVYCKAVTFICLVARCCGRGSSSPGFEQLEQIHLLLETLAFDKEGSSIVQGLIVDSAFAFAQKTPDRKHLDYAAEVEEKFCARRFDVDASLHELPEGDDDISGFRWEEGIGEWVTATPAVNAAKRKVMAAKAFVDDSECDTPYRPPPKLRRRIENEPAPVLLASSQIVSSPNFDDSMGVYPMHQSSRLTDKESVGTISGDEEPVPSESSHDESDDEIGVQSSEGGASESEDEFSGIEVSLAEESFVSHGSSASMATTISKGRPSIDRAPQLSRKALRKGQDWQLFEDSFVSNTSPAASSSNNDCTGYREFVDRAPRLGRRALRSSQAWQLFEESDDELSFLSTSSHTDQALRDVTSTGTSNVRRPRQVKPTLSSKTKGSKASPLSDSEDELCI